MMSHGPSRACRRPGHPHHVTQRGNGRARTFFGDDDYALYRDPLAAQCRAAAVEVWGWCLMPNQLRKGRPGAPVARRDDVPLDQAQTSYLAPTTDALRPTRGGGGGD